mgnify:CR=1 FL=1
MQAKEMLCLFIQRTFDMTLTINYDITDQYGILTG